MGDLYLSLFGKIQNQMLTSEATTQSTTESTSRGTVVPCRDNDANCPLWTDYCGGSNEYVMNNCKSTCGFCTHEVS